MKTTISVNADEIESMLVSAVAQRYPEWTAFVRSWTVDGVARVVPNIEFTIEISGELPKSVTHPQARAAGE